MYETQWRCKAGASPGTCPGWKGLCPGGRCGSKLIELTQRLNDELQQKCNTVNDTVLSTVTMILGHISYTVVITRLQVAESSRTSTTLFVSRMQQAQYKQQRFT